MLKFEETPIHPPSRLRHCVIKVLSWTDPWLHSKPLCITHLVLFDLCKEKIITVSGFLATHGQLTFTRWLPPFLFDQWISIINQVFSYNFVDSKDVITWSWSKCGKFTSKSMYDHLSLDESGPNFKHLWKVKLPYKIKIFLWLLENGVILTKDNLIKTN